MNIRASSYIKVAVLYALAGMVLGAQMGATETFTFVPVHAHLNLLGWVSMAIYGVVFAVFPAMAQGRGLPIHFWLANGGAIILNIGVAAMLAGLSWAIPAIMAGEILTIGAMAWFGVMAFRRADGQ